MTIETLGPVITGATLFPAPNKASVILQRCPRVAEAAKAGELSAALSSTAGAAGEFLLQNLEKEVVAELDTPWAVSVKKWRCAYEVAFVRAELCSGAFGIAVHDGSGDTRNARSTGCVLVT